MRIYTAEGTIFWMRILKKLGHDPEHDSLGVRYMTTHTQTDDREELKPVPEGKAMDKQGGDGRCSSAAQALCLIKIYEPC